MSNEMFFIGVSGLLLAVACAYRGVIKVGLDERGLARNLQDNIWSQVYPSTAKVLPQRTHLWASQSASLDKASELEALRRKSRLRRHTVPK